ncbi:MAG: hypothetical protein HY678_07585 [Chloroflexi bacterium]|nr:hypothetical protein [Chloroflexota bacterium]
MKTKRLYVATGDAFVLLVRDEKENWTAKAHLEGQGIQCLAVDPLARHVVYAGSGASGVYRSDDGGESWRSVSGGGGPQHVFSLAVSPSRRVASGGVVLAGTEPSALFVSESGGEGWRELPALRAIPSAPTWSFPPRPWTSHVRTIALSPFDPGLILAGIELGGVMRSADFGVTWADHRPDAFRDSHALALHPRVRGRAYEAAGDGGAATSFDDGDTWRRVAGGLARRYTWALAVDAVDPDRWYVSASPGPFQAHGQQGAANSVVYRRWGDSPWEELSDRGLPSPSGWLISALFADPDQPGHLYAGLRSGEVYFTDDHGESWRALPVRVPGVEALSGADG